MRFFMVPTAMPEACHRLTSAATCFGFNPVAGSDSEAHVLEVMSHLREHFLAGRLGRIRAIPIAVNHTHQVHKDIQLH
ncbi:hypothetical protein ACU4GD_35275 [Cupriavidus basilensis]